MVVSLACNRGIIMMLLLLFISPLIVMASARAMPSSVPLEQHHSISAVLSTQPNNMNLMEAVGDQIISPPPVSLAPSIQPSGAPTASLTSPPSIMNLDSGNPSICPAAPSSQSKIINPMESGGVESLQPANSPSVSLAPTIQPAEHPSVADPIQPMASPTSFAHPSKGGPPQFSQPCMSPTNINRRPTTSILGESYVAPSSQPSTFPATTHQTPTSSPSGQPFMSSAVPSFQPTMSPTSMPSMGGSRQKVWDSNLPTHTCLMSQTQNSCFVSTFPWSKYKHHTSNHLTPALSSNRRMVAHVSMQKKLRGWKKLTLAASGHHGDDDNDATTTYQPNPENTKDQQLILVLPTLLMYSIVPFLPSTILSTLNDQYTSLKSLFNVAAATLPPSAPTDSVEYLSVSGMYNETMQKLFVLLVSKRLALYFLATLATTYAGWRASASIGKIRDGRFGGPGEALDNLNKEVLQGERFAADSASDDGLEGGKDDDDNRNKKNEEDQLFATMVDASSQSASNAGNVLAVALPLVLGASLAFSYLLTIFQTTSAGVEESSVGEIQEVLSSYLPYVTPLPSAIICLLFVSTEFRWALPPPISEPTENTSSGDSPPFLCTANILALVYVMGAYVTKIHPTLSMNGVNLDLWPLQNGVNIALAATVSRALAPFLLPVPSSSTTETGQSSGNIKSIRTVALALIGLTLFDAISTFGTVANAATTDATTVVDVATIQSSMSVMETVARSRLASWQPGLLEIILGHDNSQVTEALGLGDVVFPSILVAWGFSADNDGPKISAAAAHAGDDGQYSIHAEGETTSLGKSSDTHLSSYALASIVGYLFGSFATEIVGSFALLGNRSGLPALVFLVPSMLFAVTVMAWSRNELGEVWGVGIASHAEDDAQE